METRLETVDASRQTHEDLFCFARNYAAEADRYEVEVERLRKEIEVHVITTEGDMEMLTERHREIERLREAAAAVELEWAAISDDQEEILIRTDCALASKIGSLRLTAGIKAPPADETHDPDPDGDRLPENDR